MKCKFCHSTLKQRKDDPLWCDRSVPKEKGNILWCDKCHIGFDTQLIKKIGKCKFCGTQLDCSLYCKKCNITFDSKKKAPKTKKCKFCGKNLNPESRDGKPVNWCCGCNIGFKFDDKDFIVSRPTCPHCYEKLFRTRSQSEKIKTYLKCKKCNITIPVKKEETIKHAIYIYRKLHIPTRFRPVIEPLANGTFHAIALNHNDDPVDLGTYPTLAEAKEACNAFSKLTVRILRRKNISNKEVDRCYFYGEKSKTQIADAKARIKQEIKELLNGKK